MNIFFMTITGTDIDDFPDPHYLRKVNKDEKTYREKEEGRNIEGERNKE